MKRILVLGLLFVLAGCQVQNTSVEPTPKFTIEDTNVITTPNPKPENTAIVTSPTNEPASDNPIKLEPPDLLELAARDLAVRLKIDLEAVQVESFLEVEWPDGGLGCPLPNADYAQVITPGYRISLEVEGTAYTYHADQGTFVVLCLEDSPETLPVIPIPKGERIMDGIPWKPVDPPPDEVD